MKKVSVFLRKLFIGENFYKSWLTIVTILFLWIFYEYSQNGRYQLHPNASKTIIDYRTGETFNTIIIDTRTGEILKKSIVIH